MYQRNALDKPGTTLMAHKTNTITLHPSEVPSLGRGEKVNKIHVSEIYKREILFASGREARGFNPSVLHMSHALVVEEKQV